MNDPCFRSLSPYRVKDFQILNTILNDFLYTLNLSIWVVDSPNYVQEENLKVAVLVVPKGRENDWMYDTPTGLRQLINKFHNLSRLVLVKNIDLSLESYSRWDLNASNRRGSEEKVRKIVEPLLLGKLPVFVSHERNISYVYGVKFQVSVNFDTAIVEDVEVDENDGKVETRRRIRFRSNPGFLQAEFMLGFLRKGLPVDSPSEAIRARFDSIVDTKILIQPYHQAMVYGLSLIPSLFNYLKKSYPVNVLSLGFGVGALERFLQTQLGFKVVGIDLEGQGFFESMEPHFRSTSGDKWDGVDVKVGIDAICLLEKLARPESQASAAVEEIFPGLPTFQVITLDITAIEKPPSPSLAAPPRPFVDGNSIANIAKVLDCKGVLIINVITPDFVFHNTLLTELTNSFKKVYKVCFEKEHEFVLVATGIPSSTMVIDSGPSGKEDNPLKMIQAFIPRAFHISEVQGSRFTVIEGGWAVTSFGDV